MIGERLAEVRKDHGDTQADLARHLNISLPTVRSWEQERSSPSHELLIAICKLYQISADYLLGISNIDPVYLKRQRETLFTPEELDAIRRYETFLLWQRKEED